MTQNDSATLNPTKALIWRIVHRDNLPWILDNGLHCGNHTATCPNWVSIGNGELIEKRAKHHVPQPPHGQLNDYVPFYFTPFSPMLLNIKSGRGVTQRPNEDIVILVSSMHDIARLKLDFVFTDMHAYYQWATFYTDPADIHKVDWPLLQARDFKRDQNDPQKFERYQAEFLVYQHCPVDALKGIICYNQQVKTDIQAQLDARQMELGVFVQSGWYF